MLTLCELPNELLIKILDLLDAANLYKMSETSRLFRLLAEDRVEAAVQLDQATIHQILRKFYVYMQPYLERKKLVIPFEVRSNFLKVRGLTKILMKRPHHLHSLLERQKTFVLLFFFWQRSLFSYLIHAAVLSPSWPRAIAGALFTQRLSVEKNFFLQKWVQQEVRFFYDLTGYDKFKRANSLPNNPKVASQYGGNYKPWCAAQPLHPYYWACTQGLKALQAWRGQAVEASEEQLRKYELSYVDGYPQGILWAAASGQTEVLNWLLSIVPYNPMVFKIAAVMAMKNHMDEVVHCLLQHTAPSAFGWVMVVAVKKKRIDWLNIFLQSGLNMNAVDLSGNTVLHRAAEIGDLSTLELCLAKDANMHALNRYEETALHRAASRNQVAAVAFLIKQGIDINALDQHKRSALHHAAQAGHGQVVAVLCKNGANADFLCPLENEVALHYAAKYGHYSATKMLINHLNMRQKYIQFPLALSLAMDKGHTKIVELLFNEGAILTHVSRHVVEHAIIHDQAVLLKLIFSNLPVAVFNNFLVDNPALLQCAIMSNAIECLQLLLAYGLDPQKAQNPLGSTPLEIAQRQKRLRMIPILQNAISQANSKKMKFGRGKQT